MASHVYEGVFILDSNRYGRDSEAVSGGISEIIEKAGGEMLVSRLWEERRLAYRIKGHRKGAYWLTYFRLASDQLTAVRRQCRLNETILRVLFLKVDPRIVDALVAHAQSSKPGTGGKGVPVEAVEKDATQKDGTQKDATQKDDGGDKEDVAAVAGGGDVDQPAPVDKED